MTEDRFEEFLKSAVDDFDPVPVVPREEMWARIDQARRFRRQARPAGGRGWRRWGGWAVGAAALLAAGFGLGRFTLLQRGEPAAIANAPSQPVAPDDAPVTRLAEAGPVQVGEPGTTPDRRYARPERPARPGSSVADGTAAPYRLAALRHLSRAEGLLTSVAVGEVDDQVTTWASQMLTTTRLMLDSPAAEDPRIARLLEDLELILAQIVNTTEDRREAELQWIQQGLETNNVLPRLRNALPADRTVIGT